MIRLLPIFLLAIGLVLAFSSFTRAEAGSSYAMDDSVVCVEPDNLRQAPAAGPSERTGAACWKKIIVGDVTIPCRPDPVSDVAMIEFVSPPKGHRRLEARSSITGDTETYLSLPPPKA